MKLLLLHPFNGLFFPEQPG